MDGRSTSIPATPTADDLTYRTPYTPLYNPPSAYEMGSPIPKSTLQDQYSSKEKSFFPPDVEGHYFLHSRDARWRSLPTTLRRPRTRTLWLCFAGALALLLTLLIGIGIGVESECAWARTLVAILYEQMQRSKAWSLEKVHVVVDKVVEKVGHGVMISGNANSTMTMTKTVVESATTTVTATVVDGAQHTA